MKQESNYYKYTTYGLIIIIFLGILSYLLIQAQSNAYLEGIEFGKENTLNVILTEIEGTGKAIIQTPEGNISLIPVSYHNNELLGYTQSIIDTANEQGYITLISGEEQVTLLKIDVSE